MSGHAMTYRYGCPSWADLDETAMGQLKLANDLWNSLVEIEKRHEEARAAIDAAYPEVAVAQKALDEATAECERIAEEMRASRQRDRTTVPRRADKARLAEARKARKEAKAVLKNARAAVKPHTEAQRKEAREERNAALKAARQKAAAQGLYWGSYNDICQRRFPAAVNRVIAQRTQGQAAELKFHRFDGTGTLTTQVMWQAGDPAPTPALLASGTSKWRNVVQLTPWHDPAESPQPCGAERYGTLRLRVSSDHHIVLPVVIHRFIPADAEIKEIKVSRRRIGTQHRLAVAVVCRVPEPEPRRSGVTLDVDFGWASGGKGVGLKVALVSWGTKAPPPPPADIASLVATGDRGHEIWVPAQWRDLAGRPDAIRADRDDLLSQIRSLCAGALEDDSSLSVRIAELNRESWEASDRNGEPPMITASAVAQWHAPRKLAMLARLWPQDHPLAAELEKWRQRDRHLHEFEAHERDQILARRNDAYRKIAAWLAGSAQLIVIKDLNVAAVKRIPDVSREDTYEARHGRRQAHFAAPAELKAAIRNAARAHGVVIEERYEDRQAGGQQ